MFCTFGEMIIPARYGLTMPGIVATLFVIPSSVPEKNANNLIQICTLYLCKIMIIDGCLLWIMIYGKSKSLRTGKGRCEVQVVHVEAKLPECLRGHSEHEQHHHQHVVTAQKVQHGECGARQHEAFTSDHQLSSYTCDLNKYECTSKSFRNLSISERRTNRVRSWICGHLWWRCGRFCAGGLRSATRRTGQQCAPCMAASESDRSARVQKQCL